MISWQQLLDIGNNASDENLRGRLANIAINQVVMWVVMVRGVFPTVVTIFLMDRS